MNATDRKAKAARYLKIVEWSDADECFVGRCPGLFHGGCHGSDEAEVYRQLCRIAEQWVKILEDERTPLPPATAGRSYSGKFVVRVSPDLHQRVALKAMSRGESLNQLVAGALAKA